MPSKQSARIHVLKNLEIRKSKPYIAYWCFKALRSRYNHALEYALYLANMYSMPLVAFCTVAFQGVPLRQALFHLQGIENTCKEFALREVQCLALMGHESAVAAYMATNAAAMVVDCVYLQEDKALYQEMNNWTRCRIVQVESNVVVPLCDASEKEEYAAATLRPKIHAKMHNYLQELTPVKIKNPSLYFSHPSLIFPKVFHVPHSAYSYEIQTISPSQLCQKDFIQGLPLDSFPQPSTHGKGGEHCAQEALHTFIQNKFAHYCEKHNDPSTDYQSHMSAYLRFGNISPVDIALRVLEKSNCSIEDIVLKKNAEKEFLPPILASAKAFLEELIIRRELAYNFIYYNSGYKTYSAAVPQWAQATLAKHKHDKRLIVYSFSDMEHARTADEYWNAAQMQMRDAAYMHGYMRMYWAKKILEWSEDPEEAFLFSIAQNDRYHMDGRDPNGYTGIAWCYGKHDRPWTERPIFGVVRYMNAQGIRRKYKNIHTYVETWLHKSCS